MLKKATSLALVALALAPAAALAQSAGDEQYADPLAGQDEQPSSGTKSQGDSGSNGNGSDQSSAPSAGAQTQADPATGTQANSAQSGDRATELPRTGSTVPVTAGVLGFVLLLGGTAVRRTARVRLGAPA